MKNALYATAGSALALALLSYSLPASADVTVLATITKDKDITVTERITITKLVNIIVNTSVLYRSAAEADAIVNQTTIGNDVDSSFDQLDVDIADVNDYGIHLKALMSDSVNENQGIVGVNQDVGNMSNQGNQVALAVATPANTGPDVNARVLTNAQSEAQQINTNNTVWHAEVPNPEDQDEFASGPNEVATIDGSINDNIGIVNVNQNAGNMNNQANSEALAVAISLAGVALSEAALGQVNTNPDNTQTGFTAVFEFGVAKEASMTGSLNGNTGVGGVNQAAGNMANQANIFSLAFIDGGGGVGLGQ